MRRALLLAAVAGALLGTHELLHALLHGKSVAAVLLAAGPHAPPWMLAAVLAFVLVRMAVALLPAVAAAYGTAWLLRPRGNAPLPAQAGPSPLERRDG